MTEMRIRTMTEADRSELAELIRVSLNYWHRMHGRPEPMRGDPENAAVFFDVYEKLDPGCGLVAENRATGRLMGSCFYHPRRHHVSLGIMNVHPNYWGAGVGRQLVEPILEHGRNEGKPVRLTSSAINLDSFSLYTKAGFVPFQTYQDVQIAVPENGLGVTCEGTENVREATEDDVPAMEELEHEIAGITREKDYRYCLANDEGYWRVSVHEEAGRIEGWMISSGHAAMNMLGPAVARTENQAAALICAELDHHRGRAPVFLIPVDYGRLVQQVYAWGGKNTELHVAQAVGPYQPYRGVNMPVFLPETG